MPTQTKPPRPNFGPEMPSNSPKANRTRTNQERVSKAERETDGHRLNQRQKQIDYGKNTSGYINYVAGVPHDTRSKSDPWTPDIHKKYPKRVWDVIVRTWRRQLHKYDVDADTTSPPLSPRTPPGEHASLHDSFNSEEDLIDSINDAIYKFQQDEEPSVEFEPSSVPDSSARSQLDSLIYSFDTPVSSSQSSHSSAAYMTPYSSRIASLGFLPEDSNSSMDSATSTSFFSDMGHSDMSENSSDSWHAMTFTPISLIGSPFNAPRSSSFSSNTFPHRSSRSASQHSHGSSASQHSSPYGAIGPVPRFNLPSSPAPSTPSKFAAQDENVENTSRLFWSSH